jgi:hypothetical protein
LYLGIRPSWHSAYYQRVGGALLIAASFVYAAVLWFWGAVATYEYWGWIGLAIGLIILGIGVVPKGLLALALHSQW